MKVLTWIIGCIVLLAGPVGVKNAHSAGVTFTQLTNTTGGSFAVGSTTRAISADGTRIIFVSERDQTPGAPGNTDANFELFVWTQGVGFTQLTNTTGGFAVFIASISTDGTRIALLTDRDLTPGAPGNADANLELFLWTEGVGFTQLTNTTGGFGAECGECIPSINADGTRIAFFSAADLTPGVPGNADGNLELFLWTQGVGFTQLTNTTGTTLTGGTLQPSISATGTRTAFVSDRDLTPGAPGNADANFELFLWTQGVGFTQLTNTTGGGSFDPFISADGTRIAFVSGNDLTPGAPGNADGNFELFLASLVPVLVFPNANYSPWTAPISTVFDHSMIAPYAGRKTSEFGRVTAFTGEQGMGIADPNFATGKCRCLSGYPNVTGDPLYANGAWQYSTAPYYLYYDSHPGIDFALGWGTALFPAISGRVHYPQRIEGDAKATAPDFHTLEIDPEDGSGYKVYYLHLATYPDRKNPQEILKWSEDGKVTSVCAECAKEGEWVDVTRQQPIAYSGNWSGSPTKGAGGVPNHLHFEVRVQGIAVDPYGWAWFGFKDTYVPSMSGLNVDLWWDRRPESGRLVIAFTLNGRPWTRNGSESISLVLKGQPLGAQPSPSVRLSSVGDGFFPFMSLNWPAGGRTYTIQNVVGGPAGAVLCGISPSASQTLSTGGRTRFSLNFKNNCFSVSEVPPG